MRNKPRSSLFQAGDAVLRALIRPLILAIFEALVEQQKACLIPEQALDAVLATATEQEECRLVRVQMEPRDDQGGKPVDGLPHVRMATGQIDVIRRELSDWHDENTSLRIQRVCRKSFGGVSSVTVIRVVPQEISKAGCGVCVD